MQGCHRPSICKTRNKAKHNKKGYACSWSRAQSCSRIGQVFVCPETRMTTACVCSGSRQDGQDTRGECLALDLPGSEDRPSKVWHPGCRDSPATPQAQPDASHQSPLPPPRPNRLFDWLVSVINSSICADPDSWTTFIGSRGSPSRNPPSEKGQECPAQRAEPWVYCGTLGSSFPSSAAVSSPSASVWARSLLSGARI